MLLYLTAKSSEDSEEVEDRGKDGAGARRNLYPITSFICFIKYMGL